MRQTTSATTARPGDHRRAVSATTRDDPALSNAFRAADGARPRHPAAGVFGRVARAHARPAAHTPARQPAAASLPAAGCARPGGPRVRAASGHPRGRWLRQGPLLRGPRRGPSRPQRARHRDPRPFGGGAWSKRRLGSATARHPCLPRLAMLALGGTPHSGRATVLRSAQWQAATRAPASAKVADSEL